MTQQEKFKQENTSLMEWYPWKKGASIFYVLSEDQQETNFTESYDYIVVSDVLERVGKGSKDNTVYVSFLREIMKGLKPDGKLIVIVSNQYGISNWSGKREHYSRMPFESIAGYPDQVEGRGFHRRELQDIIEQAGAENQRFFYPVFEDKELVNVFTDDRLPTGEDIDRMKFDMEDTCVFNGKRVLKDIVENGSFPFFADFFWVEAGHTSDFPTVPYDRYIKHVCLDRGIEDCFDTERMKHNRYMLAAKGESTAFKMDRDYALINQVVKIQLDLLRQLLLVCRKHNLQVYLIYGTLLGAVRHKGVIPGDDDIDVALPRKDYNKLLQLVDEFQAEYFLQTPWNDNCFFGGYLKLRNRNTTAVNPQNWWVDCCEGIGIDIFPIDTGYQSTIKEWWKEKRICFYQRMLFAKAYGYSRRFWDMPMLIWKAYRYAGKPFSRQQLADRLNTIVQLGDSGDKAPCGIFTHYKSEKKVQMFSSEVFMDKIQMSYEDMILDAPIGYEKLLTQRYSKDYMSYPTYQEGKKRHGFYAVDVPYENYKRRFAGLFRPKPENRDIVLIGESEIFQEFFKVYHKKYRPKYLIATKAEQVSELIEGIPIKEIDFLRTLVEQDIYLVISSVNIRETEQLIRQMGWREYYVFVEDRDWILLANPEYILNQIQEKSRR